MPPPPPPLVDDVVEEVLLRFPPKEPEALVRAALVCKCWCRLVSGPGFRRRFREFHRTPPMLGMFCNNNYTRVVPTSAFLSHHAELGGRCVDARHGRVLLHVEDWEFVVWDPITDEEWKVPFPLRDIYETTWAATVLCSAAASTGGCDHLDCHHRPFIVVFVASVPIGLASGLNYIYTYSSNAAAWSEPTCGQQHHYTVDCDVRSALVGNTLYFGNHSEADVVLKYNIQLRQMSWIQLPSPFPLSYLSALTTAEHGGLCLAVQDEEYKFYIWSTKDADEVDVRWE